MTTSKACHLSGRWNDARERKPIQRMTKYHFMWWNVIHTISTSSKEMS